MTNVFLSRGWPAPAKLNLFLHIIGQRGDGYHLLQTVFQLLDYGDSIDIGVRTDGQIRRPEGPPDLDPKADLSVRAAQLLRARTGTSLGADIHLRKRLPTGSGLGGGSSDAATTLVALNQLWRTALSVHALSTLGLELGADVPVFVTGHSAWAEGVGEILTPMDLPAAWFLVVDPGCRVGTREIFQVPELTRNSPPITISGFRSGSGRNVFEPVIRQRNPAVAAALDWFGGRGRLTGSGGCVFAAFESRTEAEQRLAAVPPEWRGFVAQGCNRSPLLERLEAERRR